MSAAIAKDSSISALIQGFFCRGAKPINSRNEGGYSNTAIEGPIVQAK